MSPKTGLPGLLRPRIRLKSADEIVAMRPACQLVAQVLTQVRAMVRPGLTTGELAGVPIAAMHGRLSQPERERIMEEFRAGRIRALVATLPQLRWEGFIPSPIRGGEGNQEFLACLRDTSA